MKAEGVTTRRWTSRYTIVEVDGEQIGLIEGPDEPWTFSFDHEYPYRAKGFASRSYGFDAKDEIAPWLAKKLKAQKE